MGGILGTILAEPTTPKQAVIAGLALLGSVNSILPKSTIKKQPADDGKNAEPASDEANEEEGSSNGT